MRNPLLNRVTSKGLRYEYPKRPQRIDIVNGKQVLVFESRVEPQRWDISQKAKENKK